MTVVAECQFLLTANSRKPIAPTEQVSSGKVEKLTATNVNGLYAVSSLEKKPMEMDKPHFLAETAETVF
jgi:hypothetical protein